MIRILLADDQALIRSGIRSLLEAEDDIEVVAEAADGRHAVALLAEHPPGHRAHGHPEVLDGLEATRQIVSDDRLRSVRVVILTNFGLDEYIFRALQAGASGFLRKTPSRPNCCRRCGSSCAGRTVPCGHSPPDQRVRGPAAGRGRCGRGGNPHQQGTRGGRSRRARYVQRRDCRRHGAQPATIKSHVSRAMIKLGGRDRAQLVVFAYQTGLFALDMR